MNSHQRRLTRRECMRTMTPGTEVKTMGSRARSFLRTKSGLAPGPVVVEARVSKHGVPRVLLEQRFDFGRQAMRGSIPFTSILAYRRPT